MLSREQAQALTRLVHLLRPAWNEEGIYAVLGKVKHEDAHEVCLAMLRAAKDSTTKTPGIVAASRQHWNEAAPTTVEKPVMRPPRKDEVCPRHAGSYADNCSGCRADQLAGDETLPPNLRKPDAANMLALVRAEYAQVAANLCRHKIDRQRTTCADCDADEKRATKKPAPIEEPA